MKFLSAIVAAAAAAGVRDVSAVTTAPTADTVITSFTTTRYQDNTCAAALASNSVDAKTNLILNECYLFSETDGDYYYTVSSVVTNLVVNYFAAAGCSGTPTAVTHVQTFAVATVPTATANCQSMSLTATAGGSGGTGGSITRYELMTAAPVVATGTAAMTCHYDKIVYTAATCLSGTVTNSQKAIIGNCVANTDIGTNLWKVTKCGPKDGFHFTVHASGDTTCATVSHTFAPTATGDCASYDAATATATKWLEVPYAVCAGSSCSAQFSSDSSATSLDVAATTTTTTTTTTATTTCPTTTTTDTTDGAASVLVGAGAMAMSLAYL